MAQITEEKEEKTASTTQQEVNPQRENLSFRATGLRAETGDTTRPKSCFTQSGEVCVRHLLLDNTYDEMI